jgi:hypothetical protein
MTVPRPVYSATVSYRTPAGRRVLYGDLVAASDLTECANELRIRLGNEMKYGRRRVATILDDFSATFISMQIGTS